MKLLRIALSLWFALVVAGCATTTKLVSPTTCKEELSQFSKQAESTLYQTYTGERLPRDKTAIIAVRSNMMATDKEGIGIQNISINNYKFNFMNDIDNRPKYYQLEILPGQNRLEIIGQWFYKPVAYDYIDTAKLAFNAKAGAIYFLQIYEKRPNKKSGKPHPILGSLLEGLWPYLLVTYPLWFWAVDDEYDYVAPRFVWIWDAQTEQVVGGFAPRGWSNDQDSNIK